jgi:hypothetical protein
MGSQPEVTCYANRSLLQPRAAPERQSELRLALGVTGLLQRTECQVRYRSEHFGTR